MIHALGKLWEERGLLTCRGKTLAHENLISCLLEVVDLPKRVEIIHIKGHQAGCSEEAIGNPLADEEARKAALLPEISKILALLPVIAALPEKLSFPPEELEIIIKSGAEERENNWFTEDGKQWVPKALALQLLKQLHEGSHWGSRGLAEAFLKMYAAVGLFTLAKQAIEGCLICAKTNNKVTKKLARGGRPWAVRPFQRGQVDFTEMPRVARFKYLLVIVCQLTGRPEAFPTVSATTGSVVKVFLEQIIPRYGIVEAIDLDWVTCFIGKILQGVLTALGIQWKLHTPWDPQSSGRVERMNREIKKHLLRLVIETKMPWVQLLPLALARIRAGPRGDIQLSPFELMFGIPYPCSSQPSGG